MTVPERRGSMGRESGSKDPFPVGMRVLAVDDDPTCLKLLEILLLRCQYHVTTTGQAITALKLLRENRDRFDLVISDVHMPDMDGFKLLELVGLEMDLPVIMLSGNGETQTVMKGITHGACDYLLKPVRIEELRNIWQHVIRRRKLDPRDHNNFDNVEDCEKVQIANYEGGQGPVTSEVLDRNERLNKKRKEQNEEDDDDCEENMQDNEDPSASKKPRVVWSVELHRKFVGAVNQLGIDKAVPKKILDMMNVERLTRENVASHLQKYRQYLKRLSAVASQQANMVAAFGGRNPSYLPMGSFEGFRDFQSMLGSRQLPALTSFQPNGVLGRLNSPTGFGQPGLVPSGTVQHGRIQNNATKPANDFLELQGIGRLGNPHGNLLQQHKTVQGASNHSPGGFSGGGLAIATSSNSFSNVMSSTHVLQANQQHTQTGVRITGDLGQCRDMWQGGVASTKYSVIGNDVRHQASSIGGTTMLLPRGGDEGSNFVSNSKQTWEEQKQTHTLYPNPVFNYSLSTSLPDRHTTDAINENPALNNGISKEQMNMAMIGQNSGAPFLAQDCKTDCQLDYKEDYMMETAKLHNWFSPNGCSFDDLVNAMIKPERNDATFFDGDMANDIFSLGTCM